MVLPNRQPDGPRATLVPRGSLEATGDRVLRRANAPGLVEPLLEAWAHLRGNWSWIAVVPADRASSAIPLAQGLCDAGTRLSLDDIWLVEANSINLDRASQLVAQFGAAQPGGPQGSLRRDLRTPAPRAMPARRAIVALDSPLANPLALPVALAADGVVLCVRRGTSRLSDVRQTIDTVGIDRILCCIIAH
jgi:hypothetical protein